VPEPRRSDADQDRGEGNSGERREEARPRDDGQDTGDARAKTGRPEQARQGLEPLSGARLLVFDRTCPRLSIAWRAGARLYRARGRIDAACGVGSWEGGLGWLAGWHAPIAEIQYWGHGHWGSALVDRDDVLDASALSPGHALHAALEAVRERLAPDALIWFRTCETFGATAGHDFAMRLADWTGARVAGHTHVIGFHQSGLHGLAPGARPSWSASEGLARGTADAPERAKTSWPWSPHTITCLDGTVPDAWFA
jgi:hypothetical protein